jgi:hypothetical protein
VIVGYSAVISSADMPAARQSKVAPTGTRVPAITAWPCITWVLVEIISTGSNPVAPTLLPPPDFPGRGEPLPGTQAHSFRPVWALRTQLLAERAGRGLFLLREAGQGRARKQNANTASAPSTISQATRPPSQPSTAEPITRIASRTTARTGD